MTPGSHGRGHDRFCSLLEAAEDGEIFEDITDDVTEGSNVEDIMFEVPLSDCTDSECCSRVFFFPPENLIITSRRYRILIKTVGRKVLVKYCANLFSEDQLDAIVERAAVTWLELKERRVGQGSLIKLVFGLYIKSTTYEMF